MPVRKCLVVVKDGVIVHESYSKDYAARGLAYGSTTDANTMISSDSMGKTFTAFLVGIVADRGLLDLDKCVHRQASDVYNHQLTPCSFDAGPSRSMECDLLRTGTRQV